jgi:hypothetical protein
MTVTYNQQCLSTPPKRCATLRKHQPFTWFWIVVTLMIFGDTIIICVDCNLSCNRKVNRKELMTRNSRNRWQPLQNRRVTNWSIPFSIDQSFSTKAHRYSGDDCGLIEDINIGTAPVNHNLLQHSSPFVTDFLTHKCASHNTLQMIQIIRGGGQDSAIGTNKFFMSNSDTRVNLPSMNMLYETVVIIIQIVSTVFCTILPPIAATLRAVVGFYSILPMDAIMAQIGFIYAFAGGYYPTLFAAIQAAQHCGYHDMVKALHILIDEATTAIQACDFPSVKSSSFEFTRKRARDIFMEKTKIVLATIDPVRINEAVAALYTTWLSISIVLEREFARTIALSITIAESIRPVVTFVIRRPLQYCIPSQYFKWIPIIIGWVCKATAMSLAWRIQRVLTAYTSAIAGGLMCSRALFRMIQKRGIRFFGLFPANESDMEKSHLDEFLGYTIAICGLHSQIGKGFSFEIPFPLNLVTWPFDIAERWIQWQITKKTNENVDTR